MGRACTCDRSGHLPAVPALMADVMTKRAPRPGSGSNASRTTPRSGPVSSVQPTSPTWAWAPCPWAGVTVASRQKQRVLMEHGRRRRKDLRLPNPNTPRGEHGLAEPSTGPRRPPTLALRGAVSGPLAHVSEGCKKPRSWGLLQRDHDPRGGANSGDVAQSRLGHSVASPHRGDRTPGHQLLLPVTARVPAGTTRHLEKPEPARALSLGTQCGPTRAWARQLERPPSPPPLPVAPHSSRLCRVAPSPSRQARERWSPSDSGTAERAGVALTDGAGLRRGDGRRFASRPLSWSLNPEGSSEHPLGGVRSLGRAGPPGHAHPRAHTAVPSPEAVTFHDSRGTPRRGRRVPPRLLCGSVQTRARLSPAPETVWPAWCPPPSPSSPFTHVLVSKAHLCGPLPSLP